MDTSMQRVTKGMCGLHQAGRIPHYALVKHLEPYGCQPSSKTPRLWTHKNQPNNFTLVIDDFFWGGGGVFGKR